MVVHATVLTGNRYVLSPHTKETDVGVIIIIFLLLAQQSYLESLTGVMNMKFWAQMQKCSMYRRVYHLYVEGTEVSNV